MLYIGQRKGDSHKNHCEDSHFFLDHNGLLFLGVFDGCSTGKDSHFASELISRCVRLACLNWMSLNYKGCEPSFHGTMAIIFDAKERIRKMASELQLMELELLSTIMLAIYHKNSRLLFLCVIGDGFYKINDVETNIESPDNTPNYLAYLLNDTSMEPVIRSLHIKCFENVHSFSLCSDGITAIKPIKVEISDQQMRDYLLSDKSFAKSEAMLSRKFNIIAKHSQFGDDITILRYENDETIQ